MDFTIFFIILLLCGAGLIYGFYRANVPIYLLASTIMIILGIIILSEGLSLGATMTIDAGGTPTTITSEVLTVDNSYIAQLFGYGTLWGGFFFLGVIFIIAIMWFNNHLGSYGMKMGRPE